MIVLVILLAAALALLGLGALGRTPPRVAQAVAACGLVAALAGALLPPAALGLAPAAFAPAFGIDGWSAIPLASLFLLAAAGMARPALVGALALALLAADGLDLVLFLVLAVLLAGPVTLPFPSSAWMRAAAAALGLGLALLALGGLNPTFAAMHSGVGGAWNLVLPLGALGAVAVLALSIPGLGGVAGLYVAGRLLLDLPGAATPGWWGGPLLALGAAVALHGARRSAAAAALDEAVDQAGTAIPGVALMALGAALLARGADLLPAAALAVAGALLLVLGWSLWAALLGLCIGVLRDGTGLVLARLGGVLRRAPALGLAMLAGLASMAALPLTPGFGAGWVMMQALSGAARAGGVGGLLLVAGAVAALGLVAALLAAAAIRVAGLVLLGTPRGAKAATLVPPSRAVHLGLAALVAASTLLGLVPGLALLLVQRGAGVLADGTLRGAGWLSVGLPEVPGYAAPGLAVLLVLALVAAVAAARGPIGLAAPWQGGFIEDGVGRANAAPIRLAAWSRIDGGTAVIAGLALALALVLGWAAR